jgi:N-acetyl-alpha-D-muramate 1-phosphate uridylyltransferase
VTLAGVVLAAGRGERMRPLTDTMAKPLLEVGGRSLLDQALDRVGQAVPLRPEAVAVNAHWLAAQIVGAVAGRATVSVEQPAALGTAGALGKLRDWIGGRDVLVVNADAWYDEPLDVRGFVSPWDGNRPRLMVVADAVRPDFEVRWRFAGASLLPGSVAQALEPSPSGLYEMVWSRMPVDLVPIDVTFVDCGTPADLDRARELAAGAAHISPQHRPS